MKKNVRLWLGVAVGTMGAVAHAQTASNATIYGRINTTVESQKVTGVERTTVLQNNSSRWGIKGTEDLGGGLRALYFLESGFNSDTGVMTNNFGQGTSGSLFNRESYVGLSGGFGTVRAGRITSPVYFASADYVSMHNHDTGTSSDALFNFLATGVNNNNSITYKTPKFGGADVEVAYSLAAGFFQANPNGFNELPGSNNQRNFQVAVNWVGGPLHLGGGYAQMKDRSGLVLLPPEAETKTDMFVIRALYELGAFTVGGYFERSKFDPAFFTAPGGRRSRNTLRVAGMYTMGPSEFHLNYGRAGDFSGLSDTGADQFTVAYNYNLSKRTKVYAFYTQVDQDAAAEFYVSGPTGAKSSSLALGMRHNF